MSITFQLNGNAHTVDCTPGTTVLEYLRSTGLYSLKQGCDHGECGSCTILVNDRPLNACLLLVAQLEGKQVETLEGLEQDPLTRELQERFLDEGAVQCGYCTPGMLVNLTALLRKEPHPDETAVRQALNGTLCRCTGYVKPVRAAVITAEGEK